MRSFAVRLLMIVCLPALSFGQKQDIKFEHLEGLSSFTIRCLIQDKTGFMWFGTHNGLNRYDGNKMVVFKHDLQDSTSLSDNWIHCMVEDDEGYIWLGTDGGGLNRFDPETETFKHWKHEPGNPNSLVNDVIMSIFIDSDNQFWIGTGGGGLNLFDREKQTFESWVNVPADSTSLSGNIVRAIYQDKAGVLWVGTENNGLNCVVKKDGKLSFQRYTLKQLRLLFDSTGNAIWSIFEDNKRFLWVGLNNGIARFDPERKHIDHFFNHKNEPSSLNAGQVRAFIQDQKGDLWISMFPGGLNKFNPQNGSFFHYSHEVNNPNSLRNDYTMGILEDHSGLIWVASRNDVSRFDARENTFEYWLVEGGGNRDLFGGGVRAVYEDKQGNVWVGTEGALNKYNRKTGTLSYVVHDPNNPNTINADVRIRAIHEDKKGFIWLGTEGDGLNRLNPKTGHVERFLPEPKNPHSISGVYVRCIHEDNQGFLWLGTQQGGLNRFDPITKRFKRWNYNPNNTNSLSSKNVQVIYEDQSGILWLGTDDGLNRFDPKTNEFKHWFRDPADPNSISHNKIRSITGDKADNLWIGTRGGFNQFNKNTGKFKQYTEKDGLPSEVIFGILEDQHEILWLSTPKGLCKFNPKDESFKNVKLQHDFKFDMGASFKNKDGIMYFGGLEGAIAFNPENVQINENIPPIVITTFKKFDKVVKLPKAVSKMEEIRLSYKDSFFSFEFAALDYMNPRKNQYAYRLDGFDSDWIYCGNRTFASYTNLDPGKYTFRVKGTNNAGVWNNEGTSIKITITPPYWQTWWFRITALLTISLLVYIIHLMRTKEINKRNHELAKINFRLNSEITEKQRAQEDIQKLNKELEKRVHERTAELQTSNQELASFAYSVSHDLRAPLRGMQGFSQALLEDYTDKLDSLGKDYLIRITTASNNMAQLIDDLLVLSRITRADIKKEKISLSAIAGEIESQLKANEPKRNVHFFIEKGLTAEGDRNLIKLALENLLNNAWKFTSKVKQAEIHLKKVENNNGTTMFYIKDNGIGFEMEYVDKLFEPFQRQNKDYEGTGIGLATVMRIITRHGGNLWAEGALNKGATFFFTLNQNQN